MKIVAELTGLKEFRKAWAGFPKRFESSLNRADIAARKYIVNTMKRIMGSGAWPDNAEDYRNWKSSHGYDTKPLLRTHLLMNSISHQRVAFSMQHIRSDIGWHEGMRYFGSLKGQIYKSRVPKNARKYKGTPTSHQFSSYDTQFLAKVAWWMEHGGSYRLTLKTREGKFAGEKTVNKRKSTGHGNPARPFVATTAAAVQYEIIDFFAAALRNALPKSVKSAAQGITGSI